MPIKSPVRSAAQITLQNTNVRGPYLLSLTHGPRELVRNAQRAEQAGFDFAAISDHFYPWIEEQSFAVGLAGARRNSQRH